jgi:hypothetical protein
MAGGSRQSIEQAIGSFADQGRLRTQGRRIVITDLSALRRRAGLTEQKARREWPAPISPRAGVAPGHQADQVRRQPRVPVIQPADRSADSHLRCRTGSTTAYVDHLMRIFAIFSTGIWRNPDCSLLPVGRRLTAWPGARTFLTHL